MFDPANCMSDPLIHQETETTRAVRYLFRMDVLSSVLATSQVHGVILCDARYRGRWGLRMTDASVAGFHLVMEGECWLMVPAQQPRRLLQGDVVVIPNGTPHVIADDPRTPGTDVGDLRLVCQPSKPARSRAIQGVGMPGQTRLACGAFRFAAGAPTALLAILPRVLHLPARDIQRDDLLRTTLRLLTLEIDSDAPGASVLVDRLVDVLLIGVIRGWLQSQPASHRGWLGALSDARIGRALSSLHDHPDKRFTVTELARKSGMSRAAFARRFQQLVGAAPLQWASALRIDVATRLLQTTDDSVAEIASAVGYQSSFAFSKAYKKATGRAPSALRAAS